MSLPNLGVRVDAVGTEQATAKIRKFGASVGALPRDFQAASRETQKLTLNMQKMSFAVFGHLISFLIPTIGIWPNSSQKTKLRSMITFYWTALIRGQ